MIDSVELSVVIVNYKVRDLLAQTIRSLRSATDYSLCEIIVVDNDSQDGSEELITNEFPEVRWIGLKTNVGFGKACNIGTEHASGSLLLMLNPDTIISTDTLTSGISFMKSLPEVRNLGPQVLSQDGTFQKQCHRGLPTPINAFGHFTGLSRIFPHNKKLSSYYMGWLSPEEEHEVDAISGSCFFIPTALFRIIGGFDETFFMYGEDLDICVQVRNKGKKVWYSPITKIIHFQGRSSTQRKLRSRIAFYNAMIIFSRKYAGSFGTFFPPQLIEVAVFFQAFIAMIFSATRLIPAVLADSLIINAILPVITIIRFSYLGKVNPYDLGNPFIWIPVHILITATLTLPFFLQGLFAKKAEYGKAGLISFGLCMSTLFLAYTMAFSRVAFLISAFLSVGIMIIWRTTLPRFSRLVALFVNVTPKTILITEEQTISMLITKLEREPIDIIGIITHCEYSELAGFPVLGTLDQLGDIITKSRPNQLIIASSTDWYSTIIENLSHGTLKNITIKWLPQNNPHGELKEFSM